MVLGILAAAAACCSSETVAPLMFEARELALAALYMSCNLLTASKKSGITLAQALSVPDGKTFYSQFDISEERLNGKEHLGLTRWIRHAFLGVSIES